MTQQPVSVDAAKLLSELNDECAALRAFAVLLDDEQRTLVSQHNEELLALAEAKIQLANKITALSEARQHHYLSKDTPDMAVWLKRNCPQGLPVWLEILKLANHVQNLNKTNGELIQIKLRYNQQALSALYGAAQSAAGLYGANGQTSLPSGSRTLGSV